MNKTCVRVRVWFIMTSTQTHTHKSLQFLQTTFLLSLRDVIKPCDTRMLVSLHRRHAIKYRMPQPQCHMRFRTRRFFSTSLLAWLCILAKKNNALWSQRHVHTRTRTHIHTHTHPYNAIQLCVAWRWWNDGFRPAVGVALKMYAFFSPS